MNEAQLANEHGLSRKTLSVQRDKHRDQVIIVEQVSAGEVVNDLPARQETYYRVYDTAETVEMNAIIQDAKNYATRQFLGLGEDSDEVSQCNTVTPAGKVDAPLEIKTAAPTKQETEKAAKKAAAAEKTALARKAKAEKVKAAKATKTVEAATPEPAAKAEEPFNDDDLGAMADDPEPTPEILYDKGNREHASHLKPLLKDALGADWKTKGEAKMSIARTLIAKLNGSVGVTDVLGEVLPSFLAFCKADLGL